MFEDMGSVLIASKTEFLSRSLFWLILHSISNFTFSACKDSSEVKLLIEVLPNWSRIAGLTTSEITGKNITELAIQTVADVLPDSENAKQFLTEIAEVESKYGTHRKTFKKQDSSGIFQIDRIAFDEVQRRLQPDADVGENIRNYNEKLKEELGIDLTTASFSDLNTPLYGAAFARAYLLSVPESIPTTLKARAAYWKKYYNTSAGAGTVDKYLKRVTATTSLLNRNPS